MIEAFAGMLPYVVGLLVSPFPVVAVIVLLISAGGLRKTLIFEIAWLLTSWGALLGLTLLLGAADVTGGDPPAWIAALILAIGLALIAFAVLGARRAARRRAGEAPRVPGWIGAMDRMSLARIAGVAVLLVVANPINLSALAGAALAQSLVPLTFWERALLAAIFVVLGSAGVLAPFIVVQARGENADKPLQRMRQWLILHNGALTLVLVLVFGLLFTARGLGHLLA
ncbi:GAP family protein [Actinomadura sp. 1N219]|uniref:GAP family protein n=1 Tax=Actinomadura sp. 1N219 TaxID=3375152 RepID=UPI0037A40AC0